MQVLRGAFRCFDDETNERMMRASTFEWPHAFVTFDADANNFLAQFGANHIHAVPGDRVAELRSACAMLGVDWAGMGGSAAS